MRFICITRIDFCLANSTEMGNASNAISICVYTQNRNGSSNAQSVARPMLNVIPQPSKSPNSVTVHYAAPVGVM